jgi:hypothetical protein
MMLPLTPGHRYTDAANDVEWLPYACKRQSLSSPSLKAEVDQCLAGKRIYFQGDSHSRTIFNGFTDRICGVAGAGVKQEITQHGGVCASPGQVIHGGVPECTLQEVCEWEDLYYTWRPGAYVSVSSKTLQHSACCPPSLASSFMCRHDRPGSLWAFDSLRLQWVQAM